MRPGLHASARAVADARPSRPASAKALRHRLSPVRSSPWPSAAASTSAPGMRFSVVALSGAAHPLRLVHPPPGHRRGVPLSLACTPCGWAVGPTPPWSGSGRPLPPLDLADAEASAPVAEVVWDAAACVRSPNVPARTFGGKPVRAALGGPFLYWFGPQPRICLFDYESVRQVLWNKSGHFVKTDAHPTILAMLGKGLVFVEGTDWVRHRRGVNPAFAMDKLKTMTTTMVSCAERLIKEWEELALNNKSAEVEVSKCFQELTAEVISRTAFGSSYKEGKEVFHTQKQLVAIAMATILNVQLPGFKFLPTKTNRLKWMLEKKMKTTLMSIIQPRLSSKGSGYGDDLLGLMLESCFMTEQGEKRDELTLDEIIDECKTFFFAGHETTSHLLTWTMFLLSVYPEWQERLREEVLRECGNKNPTADMLSKLKEMAMVLLETLRLYGPVVTMLRKSVSDIRLGSLSIPKGTGIAIPTPFLHRDKEVWGDNANEFDPLRFDNGITNAAKTTQALLSFSIGPRSCIGQNFTMLEAKSVMALILQKFSFTLSPKYVHAPTDLFTLQPKFGLPILLKPLDASC